MTSAIDDADLYDAGYFRAAYPANAQREQQYRVEIARLMKMFPQGGNVLDIGCGTGAFLEMMDDRFCKYGIEPSEFAREIAIRKGVMLFRNANVLDFESMDLVIFRGVLQHLYNPIVYLEQAARILRPGGTLAILATPDHDSLVYRLWGQLPPLDAPRNWVVFGHRELENILARIGFTKITTRYPYRETPYARPWSDFLRFGLSLFAGWRPFAFPGNVFEMYAVKP